MADNFESPMEFIVRQEGQFASDLQVLTERQVENARQIEANTVTNRQLVDGTLSLARRVEEVGQRWAVRMVNC